VAGRNLLNNTPFHDFIRYFPTRPMTNGPICLLRLFAGQRFNLTPLLGRNPGRRTGAGQVLQPFLSAQISPRNRL
jgi:hypothetical protein